MNTSFTDPNTNSTSSFGGSCPFLNRSSLSGVPSTKKSNVILLNDESKFKALLEATPDALVIVEQGGKIVLVNAQAEKLFNYNHDELVNELVEILIPVRYHENHINYRNNYFNGPGVRPMGIGLDLHGIKKTGEEFPVEVSLSPLTLSEGLLTLAAIRDVTERKKFERDLKENNMELAKATSYLQAKNVKLEQAESALRKSEENYKVLANISPVGIFHTDKQFDLFYINQKGLEILGLDSVSEAKGNKWLNLIHPDDKENINSLINNCRIKGERFKSEYRYLDKNNVIRWVIAEAVPEIDYTNQEIVGYIGTITDISELKNLEKARLMAIKATEEQQRRRAEEAESYRTKQEQFIDTLCHELRNPLNGIYGNVLLLQNNLTSLHEQMAIYHNKHTKKDTIMAYSTTYTNDEDLGNRKANDIENSENWNKVTTNFHSNNDNVDINDLISGLEKYLECDKESIKAIDICTRHQKTLVDDVLQLSKLDANKIRVNIVDFNPDEMILNMVNMLDVEIKAKSMKLQLNLLQHPIIAKSDPKALSQILLNLLSNAIKFTPSGGKIIISLFERSYAVDSSTLIFQVEDNGIGMSNEEKARIFNRFEQATARTYQEYGGSGLGLVISKTLIELMGGTISVQSEKSQGTKFTLTINCKLVLQDQLKSVHVADADFIEVHKKKTDINNNLPKFNVLIVEDNLINQRLLKCYLDQAGHRYCIANNGLEAIELWEKQLLTSIQPFQIILMDIEMPIMNGLNATKGIREKEKLLQNKDNYKTVVIIGLSGNAREEKVLEAKDSGMNDYLAKPYEKNILLQTMQKCVQ